jgi:hypothetical protein
MLAMSEENKKSFLEELQSLDEATKRKVAIATTAVIMIGVVYIWFGYFNSLVAGVSQQPTVATNAGTSDTGSSSGPSFFQNMQSGAAAIGGEFIGVFSHPGQYNIK